MKYLWLVLILIAIILVRIDFILSLIDRGIARLQQESPQISGEYVRRSRLVPIKDDRLLNPSPRTDFLTLLENFRLTSAPEARARALGVLRENPTLFRGDRDSVLEGRIFQWRDKLLQQDRETLAFLSELIRVLEGENRSMLLKFYSLLLDQDLKTFLTYYPKEVDTHCQVAGLFADSLPREEVVTELYIRRRKITEALADEKIDPPRRGYLGRCLDALGVALAPFEPPVETNDSGN